MPDISLPALSHMLEVATNDLGDARDDEARAHNEYLRVFSIKFLELVEAGAAVTDRKKVAEATAVGEAMNWNRAEATRGRCWDKVEELKVRIQAAQSQLKYLGMQDGGPR